jgi:hypothetical protein
MTDKVSKDSVTIAPEVFALMAAHASCHSTTVVHGVLLGNRTKKDEVVITDAFPICHENPTKVLVETSLSLLLSVLEGVDDDDSKKYIVGWYTAPELLGESKPGPVALRIVASIAAGHGTAGEPVLLVLNNDQMVKMFAREENDPGSCIQAFGKDFGVQWKEPLNSSVSESQKALKAILNETIQVKDLVDHWEAGTSSEWTRALSLTKYI